MSDYWQDRNVFITGCTGFLGSWLSKALIEKGANVIGLVRDWSPSPVFIRSGLDKRLKLVHGTVEDYMLLERVLNEYEVDSIFHLAAQTIVTIANNIPLSTFETNIRGTWNILEACRRNRTVKCVIVASSDKAYGDQDILPYSEETALEGRYPYDVSKSCADLLALSYHNAYGLPVAITRCGNFYGGGDMNFNRLVPGTLRAVLRNTRPEIRSDGSLIRDYFYIKDAVNAYLKLAECIHNPQVAGQAFNFSNEIQVTVLDLVRNILELAGRANLKPLVLGTAKGEIKHQYLSAEKARRLLGWMPVFSLEDGLKETIGWYEDHFSGDGNDGKI